MTTQETLLCGHEIVSPVGGSPRAKTTEVRKANEVVFRGTYAACKRWAKDHGLLRTQAASFGK